MSTQFCKLNLFSLDSLNVLNVAFWLVYRLIKWRKKYWTVVESPALNTGCFEDPGEVGNVPGENAWEVPLTHMTEISEPCQWNLGFHNL